MKNGRSTEPMLTLRRRRALSERGEEEREVARPCECRLAGVSRELSEVGRRRWYSRQVVGAVNRTGSRVGDDKVERIGIGREE